jgi:hypothetical protein
LAFLSTNFSNAMYTILLPYIRDNFPKATILLDQMKRNAGVTQMNNNFYAPLRNSRHGGVTNLANDGAKTVSGTAGVSQASVGVKTFTGVFDISKLAIDASKSSKLAVTPALQYQAESLASDFARAVNRQMYSDGVGILAEVAGTNGTTTVPIQVCTAAQTGTADTRTTDVYGAVNGDIPAWKYITPGQHLGFGSAGSDAVGTVSSVSAGASGTAVGSITMTTAIIGTIGRPISILDGDGNAAGSQEMQGIRAALSSTTGTSLYAGVARSTIGWTPQFGSVSEALSLSRMENSYLSAREYSQVGDQYVILLNKTLFKKYGDLLTSMRRSVDQTDLLGGWTGLEFAAGAGRVGVFLDYDVPDGEVIILNLDSWTICQVSDLDWMESPNEGAMLRVANTITYQATMVWFANLLCLAPAANGRETQKTA